jgi:hypothetical protein
MGDPGGGAQAAAEEQAKKELHAEQQASRPERPADGATATATDIATATEAVDALLEATLVRERERERQQRQRLVNAGLPCIPRPASHHNQLLATTKHTTNQRQKRQRR